MNLGKDEKDRIAALKEKVKDLKPEEAQVLILQDVAESLAIMAGKVGRKLL